MEIVTVKEDQHTQAADENKLRLAQLDNLCDGEFEEYFLMFPNAYVAVIASQTGCLLQSNGMFSANNC